MKGSAALLAALPATTPRQKAERHVASFLVSKQLDDAFQTLFEQPHPEAIDYFDQLASQLGDKPCTPAPLTDAARAKLNAWIAKQDDHPEMIELTAECDTYAWVEWNHRGDPDRNELLIGLDGPEPVRVDRRGARSGRAHRGRSAGATTTKSPRANIPAELERAQCGPAGRSLGGPLCQRT